ncbi:AMP-binding protein [Spongorhabdus nitratireducens]
MRTGSKVSRHLFKQQDIANEETLDSLFRRAWATHPQRIALADPPDRANFTTGHPLRLSYQQVEDRVRWTAARLVETGIGNHDIVLTQLPNIAEYVILYLAIARIGGVIAPVPLNIETEELNKAAAYTRPKAYIGTVYNGVHLCEAARQELPDFCRILSLSEEKESDIEFLDTSTEWTEQEYKSLIRHMEYTDPQPGDMFSVLYGHGEFHHYSHGDWLHAASLIYISAGLPEDGTLLCPVSLDSTAGIGVYLYNWLMGSARLVLHQSQDAEQFITQIICEHADYALAPPALSSSLASHSGISKSDETSTVAESQPLHSCDISTPSENQVCSLQDITQFLTHQMQEPALKAEQSLLKFHY